MIICKNQQEQQMKTEIWGDASVQILVNLDNKDVWLTALKMFPSFHSTTTQSPYEHTWHYPQAL